jgi:alpha-amylase/alpha-mannosidase (GH57 family)
MLEKISFAFCVHNHQPVGNFDSVIEEAYRRAYVPFLRTLARHPRVRIALHVSGALLEWIEGPHPEYLEAIRELVRRGQVEVMTGGFYEPVLPVIPDEDKIGQTRKLSSLLKEKTGSEPRGMWLPERVWEPSLASAIARAGVEYTVVDDSHFKSSGLTDRELVGFYLTEDQGEVIKVFSGSKRLRYLIPFEDPEDTIDYLKENTSEEHGNLLVFADDGEKFGIWPGTYKRCYDDGWLERFFSILEENSDWVEIVTFSEYISKHRPVGWVFLPTASYAEMMEWCLPVPAQLRYRQFLKALEGRAELERYGSFVKGGFWRNFLSRYPESNWMHKRMLLARRRALSASPAYAPGQAAPAALNEVWRAQCNCAYWHGVFGGLYLPHLREAIYRHIIRAELAASKREATDTATRVERVDVDGDGDSEIMLSSDQIVCYISPLRGGTLVEIDHLGLELNLVNTLGRRREAYHEQLETMGKPGDSSGEAVSIHDAVTAKEGKLQQFLLYDRLPRVCLLDHLLSPETTLEQMRRCEYEELGDFVEAAYEEKETGDRSRVLLCCSGPVRLGSEPRNLTILKGFSLASGGGSLLVEYDLSFDQDIPSAILFAPELNVLFPSGTGLKGTVDCGETKKDRTEQKILELAQACEFTNVRALRVEDHHFGFDTLISTENATKLWHFPVETVSLSESGLERVYQGTCITPAWLLAPGSKRARLSILLELKVGRRAGPVGRMKDE